MVEERKKKEQESAEAISRLKIYISKCKFFLNFTASDPKNDANSCMTRKFTLCDFYY